MINNGTVSDWMCGCVILKLWNFRYSWTWLVITLSNSNICDECCKLDVIVNCERWTYYDLGCMYELWFEILRDFTDYRDYMGLISMVRLHKWLLSDLISYNLGGSITVLTTEHDTLGDWPTSLPIQWSRGLCDHRTRLRSQPCLKIGRPVSMPRQ